MGKCDFIYNVYCIYFAVRPSYHWSLSNIIGDRIPGSPGAAMVSHGHILKTRGGIAFNGKDAWLGGGDFAGGCVSGS
jgi:hypothetical protein